MQLTLTLDIPDSLVNQLYKALEAQVWSHGTRRAAKMMTIEIELGKLKDWTVVPVYLADFFTGKVALEFRAESGAVVRVVMDKESAENFRRAGAGVKYGE